MRKMTIIRRRDRYWVKPGLTIKAKQRTPIADY